MALRTPIQARKEIAEMKKQLNELREFQEQKKFLGQRHRILSNGWRHGIVGVDDADSQSTQVFY